MIVVATFMVVVDVAQSVRVVLLIALVSCLAFSDYGTLVSN
jgi:hypothetical protein